MNTPEDLPVSGAGQPSFLAHSADSDELRYEAEPTWFGGRHAEAFFSWAAKTGASDIHITTNDQIVLDIYGKKRRVTLRRLSHAEVQDLLVGMYKNEAVKAVLSGDSDVDFSYHIRPSRSEAYRFRVNATAIYVDGGRGIQITARTIPDRPPKLESLNLEPEILANMAPKQGMVLITGKTGSGKTTLLAAMIAHLLEKPEGNYKILTYESPIEYVYDGVDKPSSLIAQTEVPSCLPTFARGTRNSLRRAPEIILVGEARDAETIGEAVTVSQTGHLLYSTVHTNGVAETVRRMVNTFPESERSGRAVDIVEATQMIVSQMLVESTDGKRVALREFLVFNEEIVEMILAGGIDNITVSCRAALAKYGQTFAQDARRKFEEGRISEAVLRHITRSEIASKQQALREAEELRKKAEQSLAAAATVVEEPSFSFGSALPPPPLDEPPPHG